MSFSNEEFQFALEVIIGRLNENGATLSAIQGLFPTMFSSQASSFL